MADIIRLVSWVTQRTACRPSGPVSHTPRLATRAAGNLRSRVSRCAYSRQAALRLPEQPLGVGTSSSDPAIDYHGGPSSSSESSALTTTSATSNISDTRPLHLQPAKAFRPAPVSAKHDETKRIVARVVSAGLMQNTVRVEWKQPVWDAYLRKFFKGVQRALVHDPATSLVTGDVVSIRPLPKTRVHSNVSHVVQEILVPFGKEISERPAVPGRDEVVGAEKEKIALKNKRRTARQKAEAGSEIAKAKVDKEGLGVRQVVRGTGRSRKIWYVLDNQVRAGGIRGNVIPKGEELKQRRTGKLR